MLKICLWSFLLDYITGNKRSRVESLGNLMEYHCILRLSFLFSDTFAGRTSIAEESLC